MPLDPESKKEITARTTEQIAYNKEKSIFDRLQVKLLNLFGQEFRSVRILGVRRRQRITKRQRIKMANELIDKELEGIANIEKDAINQVRLLDDE
jgi:hypothetical protein